MHDYDLEVLAACDHVGVDPVLLAKDDQAIRGTVSASSSLIWVWVPYAFAEHFNVFDIEQIIHHIVDDPVRQVFRVIPVRITFVVVEIATIDA